MMTIITAAASLVGALLFFLGGLFMGRGKGGSDASASSYGGGDNAELEARVFEAEQGLAQARQHIVEKNEQINHLQANGQQLQHNLQQLQQQLSAASSSSGAEDENQRLKAELKRVQGEAASRTAEHRKATAALQQTQARLQQMERELTNVKASAEGWEVKTEDVSNVNSKLAQVLEENKKLRKQLDEAKGNTITVSADNPFMSSDAGGGMTDESRGEPTAMVFEMDRLRAENARLRRQVEGQHLSDAPTASEVRVPDFPRGNTTQIPAQVSAVQKEPTHTSTNKVYPPSSAAPPTASRNLANPRTESQTASQVIPLPGSERSQTASTSVPLPGAESQTASTSIPLPGSKK